MVNYHYMFVNTKIFGVFLSFFSAGIFVATTKLLVFFASPQCITRWGQRNPVRGWSSTTLFSIAENPWVPGPGPH